MKPEGIIIYRLKGNSTDLVSWVHDDLHLATAMQARVGNGLVFEILEYLPETRLASGYMSPDMRDLMERRVEQWQAHTREIA